MCWCAHTMDGGTCQLHIQDIQYLEMFAGAANVWRAVTQSYPAARVDIEYFNEATQPTMKQNPMNILTSAGFALPSCIFVGCLCLCFAHWFQQYVLQLQLGRVVCVCVSVLLSGREPATIRKSGSAYGWYCSVLRETFSVSLQ